MYKHQWHKKIIQVLFFSYIIALSVVWGFYFYKSRRYLISFEYTTINLLPFYQIIIYIRNILQGVFVKNSIKYLSGNTIMFIPMGTLLPLMYKSRKGVFRRTILTTILIVLFIETIQLAFTVGIFDVDDIVLGAAGSMIGYLIYALFAKYILTPPDMGGEMSDCVKITV